VDPATGVSIERLSGMRGFETDADAAIVALCRACAQHEGMGKVSFGSEAALFHAAGIAAVVCGPGRIAQAHQPDEWIAVGQLAQCEAFMHALVQRLAVA
jgi:acetylornithine deacetylase